jgi:hypothetical protein
VGIEAAMRDWTVAEVRCADHVGRASPGKNGEREVG